MNLFSFSQPTDTSLTHIAQEIDILSQAIDKQYATPYGAFYAPFDTRMHEHIERIKAKFDVYAPSMLMLVGIGGSSMTTRAVQQALQGDILQTSCKLYCADTIDEANTCALLELFERELEEEKDVVLCIVTKSGTTTETLMNAALFLESLKKFKPQDYSKYVIIVTDEESPLCEIARSQSYNLIEIPKAVGGRFSAFSPSSLIPLALLGIDIHSFCAGARNALLKILKTDSEPSRIAASLYQMYGLGFVIHNFFAFSPQLLMLGNWYKQLLGESLGKSFSNDGTLVEVGITPTVSIGTTDLHSVVQLYLAGPHNTITNFVSFTDETTTLKVPSNEIGLLLPGLKARSLTEVKSAILQGTMAAYVNQNRPFTETHLTRTCESLGEFMMTKMCETIFLARLFSVNPFDQPQVELYKKETRIFLERK